jgi:hypothetical protein
LEGDSVKRFIIAILATASLATALCAQQPAGGVTASGTPVIKVTDDFMRADANPLSGNWHIDSVVAPLEIVSMLCTPSTTAAVNLEYNTGAVFPTNQKSAITTHLNTGTSYSGPGVRLDGAGNGYIILAGNITDANIYIYKITTGTPVQLGSAIPYTWMVDDKLEMDASGTSTTTLTLYINGVMNTTRTDSSSPWTSGNPGVVAYGTTGTIPTISLFCGGGLTATC